MLKVRYYAVRIECQGGGMSHVHQMARQLSDPRLILISMGKSDVVVSYQAIRYVRTVSLAEDGTEATTEHPTVDRYRIRIFEGSERRLFLSVIDPPRSGRVIASALSLLIPGVRVLFEAVVFGGELIRRHTERFEAAKLVSAKIKNFHIYDNAVGRLEVTSRAGLQNGIAPFVEGKFFEMDSMTYEIVSELKKGLVCYSSSGTVRVSEPIVELAFPLLEALL